MGISTNYYTVYGVKLPFNDEFNEAWNEVYNDSDTPCVISDGYSGEYIVLGKILYDSGDLRWGETEDSFVEIDIDSLPDIEIDYKREFVAKFPEFASLLEQPFKLMTFVHYS
jgi:hypothetical protein